MPKKTVPDKKILHYIISVAIIILILIIILAVLISFRRSAANAELEPGLAYLQSLEQTDISEIDSEIKNSRSEKLKAEMELGDINVWQMMRDVVIFGDSRAEAFMEYEVMDSQHVIAAIGHSVKWFLDGLDGYKSDLNSANPSSLVLVFGLNDVESGITVETYIEEVIDVITQFQELLPDTTIYLNSIIPCTQHAINKQPDYAKIPSWNETVKTYCEEYDIPYIDITDTVKTHTDLYENDGIHMQKDFLEYWAVDIITEITENAQ